MHLRHKPVPVAVSHFDSERKTIGNSIFITPAGTHVLMRCECGKLSTQSLDGKWTMMDVLGQNRLEVVQGKPKIVNEPPLPENWMKTESVRKAGESAEEFRKRSYEKDLEWVKDWEKMTGKPFPAPGEILRSLREKTEPPEK